MKPPYKIVGLFLALLLSPLLQQCTRSLPAPAPDAPQYLPENRFAAAIARGDVHMKHKKVLLAKQGKTDVPTPGGAKTLKVAQPVCYDYYTVYYDNTGTEVGRDFLYSDCPDTGIGSSGGSGGSGGGGGSEGGGASSPSGLSPDAILALPPDKPINNLREYLKCFTASQGATFTIYARQPKAGKPDAWSGNPVDPNVGHTFISITQNGITRVVGFYPTSKKSYAEDGPSIMGDNSQAPYSVQITTTISPTSLANLLNYINSHSGYNYRLYNYNCTDFAVEAAGVVGLMLPDPTGSYGLGECSTPGMLGQGMRTMPLPAGATRSLAGTSPANAGGC